MVWIGTVGLQTQTPRPRAKKIDNQRHKEMKENEISIPLQNAADCEIRA